MQTQLFQPGELLVQRSRAVRARGELLCEEQAALIARGAELRTRAHQALLHAHLVRSAAGHTLLQSAEAALPPWQPLPPRSRSGFLPVAAFSELVAEFLLEMARAHHGETAGHGDARDAYPQLERMQSLIARGRELQHRPAYLALLPAAPVHERQA